MKSETSRIQISFLLAVCGGTLLHYSHSGFPKDWVDNFSHDQFGHFVAKIIKKSIDLTLENRLHPNINPKSCDIFQRLLWKVGCRCSCWRSVVTKVVITILSLFSTLPIKPAWLRGKPPKNNAKYSKFTFISMVYCYNVPNINPKLSLTSLQFSKHLGAKEG